MAKKIKIIPISYLRLNWHHIFDSILSGTIVLLTNHNRIKYKLYRCQQLTCPIEKQYKVSTFRQNMGEVLEKISQGEEIFLTHYGKLQYKITKSTKNDSLMYK